MPISKLLEHLSKLSDHRMVRRILHRLDETVFVAICAVIGGAENWNDIVGFGHNKLEWLRRLFQVENKIPVDHTFARVLSVLSLKAVTER